MTKKTLKQKNKYYKEKMCILGLVIFFGVVGFMFEPVVVMNCYKLRLPLSDIPISFSYSYKVLDTESAMLDEYAPVFSISEEPPANTTLLGIVEYNTLAFSEVALNLEQVKCPEFIQGKLRYEIYIRNWEVK